MASSQETPRHVAVFAFPFASHPAQILKLVHKFAEYAPPSVTFSFFSTSQSNRTLFSSHTLGNIRAYDVADGVPKGYVFTGKPMEDINFFLAVAEEEFRKAVKVAEEETGKRIGCVVADSFLWFAGDIAAEMGVPWVARAGGAWSLTTHCHTDLIRQTVGVQGTAGREDELLTFIPGFSSLRLGDLPSGIVFGNLHSPFSVMLHKMGQNLPRATAVFTNCFEEQDPELTQHLKQTFKLYLSVGPWNLMNTPKFLDNDEYGCSSWLSRHNPGSVAYIAFGSKAMPPPHELVALAEALQESNTPFLWAIKDGLKNCLPEDFLGTSDEIGKIVSWAPQAQVLNHDAVGVFITHGGWNSTVESIGAGVPLISRPIFGDQHTNTYMMEKVWGIGTRVEGGVFTKSGTMGALEQVLLHEKGKKMKEKVVELKELAHKAVGENGSSTKNFKTLLEVICNGKL